MNPLLFGVLFHLLDLKVLLLVRKLDISNPPSPPGNMAFIEKKKKCEECCAYSRTWLVTLYVLFCYLTDISYFICRNIMITSFMKP